jgi:type III pantothenate kinase
MLVCDIGNSSVDLFDGNTVKKLSVDTFDPATILETIYYVNVHPTFEQKIQNLKNWKNLLPLISFPTEYADTMGIDRKIACYGVENGVIIDAGSAITVDLMLNGKHLGGAIFAGIEAMRQTFTRISTKLTTSFDFEVGFDNIAQNTQHALTTGALSGVYYFVKAHQGDLPIICTGGDAQKIAQLFDHATVDKYLIFNNMLKVIHANSRPA